MALKWNLQKLSKSVNLIDRNRVKSVFTLKTDSEHKGGNRPKRFINQTFGFWASVWLVFEWGRPQWTQQTEIVLEMAEIWFEQNERSKKLESSFCVNKKNLFGWMFFFWSHTHTHTHERMSKGWQVILTWNGLLNLSFCFLINKKGKLGRKQWRVGWARIKNKNKKTK